jgi:hypothetical protein
MIVSPHRHVVANHVKVAFAGVKLDGKASWVTNRLRAASTSRPVRRGSE